jgi:23S rRNA (uracil1939-C5)-methyltransferase/tRNA (uracil-5-)-methyltransferase
VRDLRSFMESGYQPVRIQPFDLFPQTKHLECVITLDRV